MRTGILGDELKKNGELLEGGATTTTRSFRARIREQWELRKALICMIILFLVTSWIFQEVAGEVMEGETQLLDMIALRALRTKVDLSIPIGPSWLLPVMIAISALGSSWFLTSVTVVTSLYLYIKRRLALMAFFALSVSGGAILMSSLKLLIHRERPSVVPFLEPATQYSFPSGHSMVSAIVYLTLGALLSTTTERKSVRIALIVSALLLTFLIGVSRAYLGVHYPTDIIAGWTAGLSWASLSYLVSRWMQYKGKMKAPEPAPDQD